jgi:putative ABC transport system permease protein
VVLTDGQASDGQASPVGIGTQITVTGVPGSPRLTVVGTATSITHTAQAWVAPAEIAALRAPGSPDLAQMLYRFAAAGTTAEVTADVAALRAALPPGALLGAQSWLTVQLPATDSISPWSWWQQAVFGSCTLIALAALTLVVIKDLLPRPERRGPGTADTRAAPHDQGTPMIEVHELAKHHGGTAAVDRLSFTVRPGRVPWFPGPNGAGQ